MSSRDRDGARDLSWNYQRVGTKIFRFYKRAVVDGGFIMSIQSRGRERQSPFRAGSRLPAPSCSVV